MMMFLILTLLWVGCVELNNSVATTQPNRGILRTTRYVLCLEIWLGLRVIEKWAYK